RHLRRGRLAHTRPYSATGKRAGDAGVWFERRVFRELSSRLAGHGRNHAIAKDIRQTAAAHGHRGGQEFATRTSILTSRRLWLIVGRAACNSGRRIAKHIPVQRHPAASDQGILHLLCWAGKEPLHAALARW